MFLNLELVQFKPIWHDSRPLQSSTSWDFRSDLLTLIHIEHDCRKRKDRVHLTMVITSSYLSPILLAIFWAICLWNIEHSIPTLPETENTNGMKKQCSILITRLLHWHFFYHRLNHWRSPRLWVVIQAQL